MIRAFLKCLFISLICAAIFYYIQWNNLEADTQYRIERAVGFLPVILLSLMGSYTLIGLGMVIIAALRGLSPTLPKLRRTKPAAVPHTLLATPKGRSQS